MNRLRSTSDEQLARFDHPVGGESVEAPTRPVRFGILALPTTVNPSSIFEAVDRSIHRWAGPLRSLHDRPAVQLCSIIERLKQNLHHVKQRTGNPGRTCHDAYIT
jgi:hypothetical protein